ncbi:hypothetical protein [Bergeyella zoohelcum]|uniref:hypothetical protein n=1 Tax=Bergeyella zoohelcum TaxID=1015 RepID=UPI00373641CD
MSASALKSIGNNSVYIFDFQNLKHTNYYLFLQIFFNFSYPELRLNTYLPIPEVITNTITLTAKAGLHLTLFLIGSTLSYETLRNVGVKPLIFSVLLWIGISLLGLLMVYEMS